MREGAGVTICVVTHNEERNLLRALRSIAPSGERDFPWEILLVDNASRDRTVSIGEDWARDAAVPLRVLRQAENHLGRARATAVREARYPVVAFLDADCEAPPFWLERLRAEFLRRSEAPRFLALGSGNLPPREPHPFYEALHLLFSTWLGSLGALQVRPLREARAVDHLPTCNVFYHRERALALGNFSPAFAHVGEDLEFSWRARRAGFELFFLPGLEVTHHHSPSWRAWAAKMFRYGRGQIEVARLHPRHLLGVKALPALTALGALALLAWHPLWAFALALLWAGSLAFLSVALAAPRGRRDLIWPLFLGYATTQAFYGAGEFWGMCRLGRRQDREMHEREG